MSDSFLYQPHVHQASGVLTPDLVIDRLTLMCPPDQRIWALPIHLLSTAISFQQLNRSGAGCAALALVSAANGTLVTIGSAHCDTLLLSDPGILAYQVCAKPIAREAMRLRDLQDLASWKLTTLRNQSHELQLVATTVLAELPGLLDILEHRTTDFSKDERAILFISSGHRDPSPQLADGYTIELGNDKIGLRFVLAYSVQHLSN
jgi:hypothetical protein